MRKICFIAVLIVLSLCTISFAMQADGNPTISSGETRNGITAMAGRTVSNNGRVNDDFFAAGESVINNGQVDGDIFAAGRSVVLGGSIGGDIRAVGYDISIKGAVAKNITAAGYSVLLDDASYTGGTAVAAGNQVIISGIVNKTLYAAGNNVVISGTVNGDAYVHAESLTIQPGARIRGNLSYASGKEANIAPGAVLGSVDRKPAPIKSPAEKQKGTFTFRGILFKILWFVGTFVLGVILLSLFGDFFTKTAGTIKQSWAKYLGAGALTFVAVPVAAIVLTITFIGIPMAISLVFGYLLLLFISQIPVSVFLGGAILKDKDKYLKLLVGLAIITVARLIPIVKVPVALGVLLIGMGLLVYNMFFARERA